MGKNRRPHKPYRPKYAEANIKLKFQPWKVQAVFSPLESILEQLEKDGTIDVAGARPVFQDHNDGCWYESSPAIRGVVEAYQIHERRTGRPLNLEPLSQLANKLEYGMPIFEADTKACWECLARMRAETVEMTAAYARDLIKDYQILEAMQEIA